MLADDFEARLARTFEGGTPEQRHSRRDQVRPLMMLAPIIRRHPIEWRDFQGTGDEQQWDAHLLHLGRHLSALGLARQDRALSRFCCENGSAAMLCCCKGCAYMANLVEIGVHHRDHARVKQMSSPNTWLRLASLYHSVWLAKQQGE